MPPTPNPDPLTVALEQAMQAHQTGRLAEAEHLYQHLLTQAPQHPDALHLLGVLKAQQGDFDSAHELIWQAIAANPEEAMFHNNLANVCVERGRFDQAEVLYVKAIELDGGRLDAMSNLGLLLAKTGRSEDAEKLLLRVVELAPANPDWRQNLANLYYKMGRESDALQQCHDGLVIAPRSKSLRALLVMAYTTMDLKEKAEEVLRAWLKAEPGDAYARHHLAACTGKDTPERAGDAYVTGVFDGFARSFDAKLADLSYQAPALVQAEVKRLTGAPAKTMDVLDGGCGTGLCGLLLGPFARQLTGVDLSEGMLRKAASRQIYDELIQGELVAFLASRPASYELVASADTLCYFGRLEAFADAALKALRSKGWLVFTVEALLGKADSQDYVLQGHGRYSHSASYVVQTMGDAGMTDVQTQPVMLRNEGGKPVDGWLVSARAP